VLLNASKIAQNKIMKSRIFKGFSAWLNALGKEM